jgi:AcrR family transcriptional regulator
VIGGPQCAARVLFGTRAVARFGGVLAVPIAGTYSLRDAAERLEAVLKTSKAARRPPEGLSEQQIVQVALTLIKRDGADQFSMRQLAKSLRVTPMAVYYYFSNKDALFERIGDTVLARVPRPAPSGRLWRDELRAYALAGFRLLSEYPGLSAQVLKRPPGRQSEELAVYGISILVAAGFELAVSALAITTFHAYMFGMIGLQAQLELRARRDKRRPGLNAPYLDTIDVTKFSEFGVDALLSGLELKLAAKRKGGGASAARPPADGERTRSR